MAFLSFNLIPLLIIVVVVILPFLLLIVLHWPIPSLFIGGLAFIIHRCRKG